MFIIHVDTIVQQRGYSDHFITVCVCGCVC